MIGSSGDNPEGALHYSIEAENLAPGDSITLRLQNSGSSRIGYNLTCSWADKKTNTGWIDANIRRAEFCNLYLSALEPGKTTTTRIQIDSSAAEGTYRFGTTVEVEDESRTVFTHAFRIGPEIQ